MPAATSTPEGQPSAAAPSSTPEQSSAAGPIASQPAPTELSAEELRVAEQRAYERARPVFERHCSKCHTSGGKQAKRGALRHFSMDAYPFGGHHAGEMAATIREVLGATGEEATMPDDDPGSVQGEELAAVLEWAAAFERSYAAGLQGAAHDAHGHGH